MPIWTRSRGLCTITVSRDGSWHHPELTALLFTANHNRMLASVLDIKTPSAPPRLSTVFTFVADTSISPVKLATVPTPSGALLLMSSPTRPTASLALFHPAYPAVMDARDLPRSLSTIREIIMLGPRVAGVSCRISTAAQGESATAQQEKDAVYLVDVNVSAGGIAQLLSSADLTARYIVPANTATDEEPTTDSVAARDRAFLDALARALRGSETGAVAPAMDVFNAYEIAEGDPFALRTKKLLKIREQESAAVKARSTAKLVGEIIRLVLESALGAQAGDVDTRPVGDEAVVTMAPRGAYPHAIVRSLIKREWVSDGMWAHGGVVRALLALGDWVRGGVGSPDERH